jgi:lysophospholipase L1-like esterase
MRIAFPSLRSGILAVLSLLGASLHALPALHLVGDSTLSDKKPTAFPETGWGQALRTLLEGRAVVHNHAANGRSSKSFRAEGRWEPVLEALREGDVLVLQFGHNDQKIDSPERYAEAWSDYRDNLREYALEARARGATVILATSIRRRHWTQQGFFAPTLDSYPAATRQLASEIEAVLVDLNALTARALEALGPEASRDWFLHLPGGRYPSASEDKVDNTHLSPFGAESVARLFLAELRRQEADFSWLEKTPPYPALP